MGLAEPFELLDLQDGQTLETHIVRWEEGEITINPRHMEGTKTVQGLRLHVPTTDKAHFPYYWDTAAKTLVANLKPLLQGIVANQRLVRITKRGVAPAARFTVEVV